MINPNQTYQETIGFITLGLHRNLPLMKRFPRNLARIQVKSFWEDLKLAHNNKKEKEEQWKNSVV